MALLDHLTFTTVLKLYRPTQPPRITAGELGQFLIQLADLDFLQRYGGIEANLRLGQPIDADTLPISSASAPWDMVQSAQSARELGWLLRGNNETVYRASIRLGQARPELLAHLAQSKKLLEGEDLQLSECSLEIGPVEALRLVSDDHFMVGWMSINFSGLGHVALWESRRFLDQAGRHPALQRLMALCRAKWPTMGQAEHRLPRPRYPLPWDWNWGICESAQAGSISDLV